MLRKLEFSRHIFEKYSNIKLHENPYSGGRIVHADGRTDMKKLIVSFHNFANAPTKVLKLNNYCSNKMY
jgi:hypothetical protein